MTENSGPFESSSTGLEEADWQTLEDVVYPYFGYVQNYLNELAVSAHSPTAGMSVDVATGGAVIGSSRYRNGAVTTVTIDAADPTQDRYDLIVVQRTLNPPSSTIIVTVHKGTTAPAGTAIPPTRTWSSTVQEIVLAQIFVVHGIGAITSGQITDKRKYTYCGAFAPAVGGLTIEKSTGDFDFDAQCLINVADPVSDQDGDTKAARNVAITAAIAALPQKAACVAATTANITIATALNNGDTLDGVTLVTGDRVLVKDQTTGSENGLYVVGSTPARSTDFDESAEILGAEIFVIGGTVNAGTKWGVANTSAITVGSTTITFRKLSQLAVIAAGAIYKTMPSYYEDLAFSPGSSYTSYGFYVYPNWRVYITAPGTVRVAWSMKTSAGTVYAKVYKNGSAVGTEKTSTSSSYEAQTDDITVAAGDYLDMGMKSSGSTAIMTFSKLAIGAASVNQLQFVQCTLGAAS